VTTASAQHDVADTNVTASVEQEKIVQTQTMDLISKKKLHKERTKRLEAECQLQATKELLSITEEKLENVVFC
jgi:hypothetical protein